MDNLKSRAKQQQYSAARKQSGAILIMFTIGLFSLLAVAAMAIDGSHLLLSKSRLQNVVDASALNAAKVVQDGGTLYDAREAAIVLIQQNLAFNQNNELEQGIDLLTPDYNLTQVTDNIVVEFSKWPDPFEPTLTPDSEYVRVRIENVELTNFLADVMGFNKAVRASAVAGRSTDIACHTKLVPMMICADETTEVIDGVSVTTYSAPPTSQLYVMKSGPPNNESGEEQAIGPGNFQLLDFGISPKVSKLSESLAGGYIRGDCLKKDDEVDTEPGSKVGQVAQGLNTRMGIYNPGNMSDVIFPPDNNVCQGVRIELVDGEIPALVQDPDGAAGVEIDPRLLAYRYASYDQGLNGLINQCDLGIAIDTRPEGVGRRELEVVIGICDGITNGSNTITVVDTGCFFLTQRVDHTGSTSYVIGEFARTCSGAGKASLDPGFDSDSSTIVLYRDPASPDS